MTYSSRCSYGATAHIVSGIDAFLVPFLLHSPSPQGTSTSSQTPGGNGGGGTTPTTPSGGDNSGSGASCSEAKSHGPSSPDNANGNGNGIGNALGVMKNKPHTTVALVQATGGSNPAFPLHHDPDRHRD